MTRVCKTDQIRAAWAAGDQIGALRIAARFFDRSDSTKAFQRGMDANNHPGFYRQIGQEPQELITSALDLLAKRGITGAHREQSLVFPGLVLLGSELPPVFDYKSEANIQRQRCSVP